MWGSHRWATAMWGGSLAAAFAMAPSCRLYVVDAENRVSSVDSEDRFERVAAEPRTSRPTCAE